MVAVREWEIWDESREVATGDVLRPFRVDEERMRAVAAGAAAPTLHLWRHHRALVLGYRDTRLPRWQEAAAELTAAGYAVGVRPSGGMAVPLDPGVLNISLIYPDPALTIDSGFAAMHRLLGACLSALGLRAEVGEVAGGYCPGKSDVSCGGRKVAGVAQRRTRGGAAVQAFLLVEGQGADRGEVAARFYARAAQGLDPRSNRGPLWPQVQPGVMASLQEVEVAGPGITVDRVARTLAELLHSGGVVDIPGKGPVE